MTQTTTTTDRTTHGPDPVEEPPVHPNPHQGTEQRTETGGGSEPYESTHEALITGSAYENVPSSPKQTQMTLMGYQLDSAAGQGSSPGRMVQYSMNDGTVLVGAQAFTGQNTQFKTPSGEVYNVQYDAASQQVSLVNSNNEVLPVSNVVQPADRFTPEPIQPAPPQSTAPVMDGAAFYQAYKNAQTPQEKLDVAGYYNTIPADQRPGFLAQVQAAAQAEPNRTDAVNTITSLRDDVRNSAMAPGEGTGTGTGAVRDGGTPPPSAPADTTPPVTRTTPSPSEPVAAPVETPPPASKGTPGVEAASFTSATAPAGTHPDSAPAPGTVPGEQATKPAPVVQPPVEAQPPAHPPTNKPGPAEQQISNPTPPPGQQLAPTGTAGGQPGGGPIPGGSGNEAAPPPSKTQPPLQAVVSGAGANNPGGPVNEAAPPPSKTQPPLQTVVSGSGANNPGAPGNEGAPPPGRSPVQTVGFTQNNPTGPGNDAPAPPAKQQPPLQAVVSGSGNPNNPGGPGNEGAPPPGKSPIQTVGFTQSNPTGPGNDAPAPPAKPQPLQTVLSGPGGQNNPAGPIEGTPLTKSQVPGVQNNPGGAGSDGAPPPKPSPVSTTLSGVINGANPGDRQVSLTTATGSGQGIEGTNPKPSGPPSGAGSGLDATGRVPATMPPMSGPGQNIEGQSLTKQPQSPGIVIGPGDGGKGGQPGGVPGGDVRLVQGAGQGAPGAGIDARVAQINANFVPADLHGVISGAGNDAGAGAGKSSGIQLPEGRQLPADLATKILDLAGKGQLPSDIIARMQDASGRIQQQAVDGILRSQEGAKNDLVRGEISHAGDGAAVGRAGADGIAWMQSNRATIPGLDLNDPQNRQFLTDVVRQLQGARTTQFEPGSTQLQDLLHGFDPAKVATLQVLFGVNPDGTRAGAITGDAMASRLTAILSNTDTAGGRSPAERLADALRGATTDQIGSKYLVELTRTLTDLNRQLGIDGPKPPVLVSDLIARSMDPIGRPAGKAIEPDARGLFDKAPIHLDAGAFGVKLTPAQEALVRSLLDARRETTGEKSVGQVEQVRAELNVKAEVITRRPETTTARPEGEVAHGDIGAGRITETSSGQKSTSSEDGPDGTRRDTKDPFGKSDKPDDKHKKKEEEEAARKRSEEEKAKQDAAFIALMAARKLKDQKERELKDKEQQQEKDKKNEDENKRRRYVIRVKDTLQSIATTEMRDLRLAPLIYEINKNVIPRTVQDGKEHFTLQPGQVIWLPSQIESREFRKRLLSGNAGLGSGDQPVSAEDELTARYGANWDGTEPGAGGAPGSSLMGEAAEAARIRRQNIESLLGPVSKGPENTNGRIRYVVRLSDTLTSIAGKHPALLDERLWTLLARVNNLPEDADENGQPIAKLNRGNILFMPTAEEIISFMGLDTPAEAESDDSEVSE